MKGDFWARGLREALALATQARYLAFDWRESRLVGAGPTVVLLHGLYASAGVFRPIRAMLRDDFDATILSFSYVPGPGIVELAERLQALLREEPAESVHLIGHSLGGLVMRYYVQELEGAARVAQTTSLASPFRGSSSSWLVPGDAGRDVSSGSPLLERIRQGNEAAEEVPHLSIAAADDALILPNAFPEYGERLLLPRVGHNGILFDPRVASALAARIRRFARAAAPCYEGAPPRRV